MDDEPASDRERILYAPNGRNLKAALEPIRQQTGYRGPTLGMGWFARWMNGNCGYEPWMRQYIDWLLWGVPAESEPPPPTCTAPPPPPATLADLQTALAAAGNDNRNRMGSIRPDPALDRAAYAMAERFDAEIVDAIRREQLRVIAQAEPELDALTGRLDDIDAAALC